MCGFLNFLTVPSQKIGWLISLWLFLCFPATMLFQEHLGLSGLIIYVITVFIVLLAALNFEKSIFLLIEAHYTLLVSLIFIGLVIVFAIVYPLETSGRLSQGSDRDEALNIAVAALLAGRYPYYEKTPIDNEITPLPGAILLSTPFVALGNSAYQNLFWLLVFAYITNLYLKSRASALLLLILALLLSPVVQYEFISGGDVLANSLYVITFLFFTIRAFSKADSPMWLRLASSAALGISLASRANFFLLLPLIFAILIRKTNLTMAIMSLGVICFSTALIILPFYFFDPGSFTPFTASNKLAAYDDIIPFASARIIIVTLGLSLILAMVLIKKNNSHIEPLFFWMCALIQFFPMFVSVVLESYLKGRLDFAFMHDRYGLMFLFFGLWGCWPYLHHHGDPPLPEVRPGVCL